VHNVRFTDLQDLFWSLIIAAMKEYASTWMERRLATTENLFTLNQMIDTFESGEMFGERVERDGMSIRQVEDVKRNYFKEFFGIDIKNKQP